MELGEGGKLRPEQRKGRENTRIKNEAIGFEKGGN